MIRPDQLWPVIEAVDMRLGIDGLLLKIPQALGRSPCDGTVYAFRNHNGNRIKVLIWDGTGVWLCVRRLHHGRFTWPQSYCTLNPSEWCWLTTGIDWRRLQALEPVIGHLKSDNRMNRCWEKDNKAMPCMLSYVRRAITCVGCSEQ